MNHEIALMRDLCDTLMQNHANIDSDSSVENFIVEFRSGLTDEQKIRFNAILDRINIEDSEYAYEAFRQGISYAGHVKEYR